jgi:hypothetical protein
MKRREATNCFRREKRLFFKTREKKKQRKKSPLTTERSHLTSSQSVNAQKSEGNE